jgi:hypothetical protein
MAIAVRVEPDRLSAPAGSDVDRLVHLTNPHGETAHVRVVVSGEVAGWAYVEPADVLIAPGDTVTCRIRFRLPRGAPGGVGEVPFVVRALSDVEGIGGATANGSLAVEGQSELALRLVPGTAKGTLSATVKVAADNLGTSPARAQLLVSSSNDVSISVDPDSVMIEPGSTEWAKVTLKPTSRFFSGAPRGHEFWVRLDPLGGARVSVEGRMLQRSILVGVVPKVFVAVLAAGALVLGLLQLVGGNDDTDLAADDTVVTTAPTSTTVAETTTTAAPAVQPDPNATTTTVPLKDRRVAFQTKRDGNFEIYTSKPDGTDPKNLTLHPAHDSEPTWSPDGARVAFDSDRTGNFDVWVMNADGTNPIQLTTEPTPDGYPSWSPDGTKLAFISFRDGTNEVYVMNAAGSAQTRLTKNLSDDARPSWSPDGTKLAFHTDRDGNYEIYVMNVDGTAPQNLSNNVGFDQNPAWAPNGTRLAFDSTRDGGRSELYLMGADGSLPVRLTQDEFADKWPDWSPDGTRLVFQSDREGDVELYTVAAGGGPLRRLTEFPGEDAEASW